MDCGTLALNLTRCLELRPELVRKSRLQELLKDRETVHQARAVEAFLVAMREDDLIDMLVNELEEPNTQASLPRKDPLYAPHSSKGADVMTLEQAEGSVQSGGRLKSRD